MEELLSVDRESVYRDFAGSGEMVEIPCSREYYGHALHVCISTGLVRAKEVRSAEVIANDWSHLVYGNDFSQVKYTSRIPAVKARHTYVAGFLASFSELRGKVLCDLGAGEGQFLEIVTSEPYSGKVFAVEPSERNCSLLKEAGFDCHQGTVESYRRSNTFIRDRFDFVTINWTLCNSSSPLFIVKTANELLKPGGLLLIAESSRILVPFKKPLGMYFSPLPPDLHPFHFSFNALRNLLTLCDLDVIGFNRFLDSDYLCVVSRKAASKNQPTFYNDDYKKVLEFFERWHLESKFYM